ncbi:MAG TPA: transcription antitermination factor NusB [Gammaproteobacteria bacterium]|nr:transcription antitermination factor NusB [Gammaproteobacteria bacterium]
MTHERGAGARHLARELLVKALYQWQIAGHSVAEISAQFAAHEDFERSDRDFFGQLLAVTIEDVPALDVIIARQATRGVEQLDAVARAILLLGLAELKFRDDVPSKVVINEAVELAKRYGPAESYKFVNAVLDKSSRELRGAAAKAGSEP